MNTALQLILICGIIIIAYLNDVFARKTKIPAVLFLIILGILMRQASDHFKLIDFDFKTIIPVLGTFGLILIVFEGALELDYEKQKNRIIRNSFLSSLIILAATSVAITFLLSKSTGLSFHQCLVNAIPLSIISSAIAIPSVVSMTAKTKEFITYESTFSDILGIIYFNYAVTFSVINTGMFMKLGAELVLVTLLSLAGCLLLLFLLKKITHLVKFILIITVMVFLFSIGKYFHLSSLILVLVFGLFLKNLHLFSWPLFQKYFVYDKFEKDFGFLHQITAEGVFLVKTFFFIIFGFIIDFEELLFTRTFVISLIVVGIIYVIRAVFIRLITKSFLPITFISPRGLITILLYLSIPEEFRIPEVNAGVLFLVVLITSLMMLLGRRDRKI
ncbi:MAG: sodium:proton antiporter [Porphyromonadaceae bacterium]|nr:MAG: sodium:proton antiporter [Porphyromonadaceae bacterium]